MSSTTHVPPHDESIERALEALQVPLSAAEAHGLACGLLCSSSAARAKSRWFTELLEAASLPPDALAARADRARTLDAWFEATAQALHSVELAFEPRLPDDELPMPRRLDALGDFCAGFTYGLGLGSARRGNAPLPEDTQEIVRDLQAIDGAERDDAVDEADYAELVEYVRVGVLVVLEELRPISPAPAPDGAPRGDTPLH